MAIWEKPEINQSYTITPYTANEINFDTSGIYEIIIRGGSGQGGWGNSYDMIPLGTGGGGGAYAYFKINIGSDSNNNKVIATFSNEDEPKLSTVKISTDNPTDWRATYAITSGENGKDFNLADIPSGDELPKGGTIAWTPSEDDATGDGAIIYYRLANGGQPFSNEIKIFGSTYVIPIKGGLGGKDEATGEGFSGGDGEIKALSTGIGAGKSGNVEIIYLGDGNNTTPDDEDSTGNENLFQPFTTISDILTKQSIQDIKVKVNKEIKRRQYYGNISSNATDYFDSSQNLNLNNNIIPTATDINEQIIGPLNLITYKNNNQDLKDKNINTVIGQYYINDPINSDAEKLVNALSSFPYVKDGPTGCNYACTGLCKNYCADLCSGNCGTSCGDNCGKNCSTNGSGETTTSKKPTSCGGNCNKGAKMGGLYGDDDPNGGCYCSGGCQAGCGNSCKGLCGIDAAEIIVTCKGSCGSKCKDACYDSCKSGCNNSCSNACANSCQGGCANSAK